MFSAPGHHGDNLSAVQSPQLSVVLAVTAVPELTISLPTAHFGHFMIAGPLTQLLSTSEEHVYGIEQARVISVHVQTWHFSVASNFSVGGT